MATARICGRRGPDYHLAPRLNPGMRAPVSLSIDYERSRYGRRRWHSRDPHGGATFTSCHRNRVALHALLEATNGGWPFWIADSRAARIERLYDAEAYLPLPIGRHAALVGNRMPGPTRQKPHEHTYCYHLDQTFIRTQLQPSPRSDVSFCGQRESSAPIHCLNPSPSGSTTVAVLKTCSLKKEKMPFLLAYHPRPVRSFLT